MAGDASGVLPAYIAVEQYHANLARLAANAARAETPGVDAEQPREVLGHQTKPLSAAREPTSSGSYAGWTKRAVHPYRTAIANETSTGQSLAIATAGQLPVNCLVLVAGSRRDYGRVDVHLATVAGHSRRLSQMSAGQDADRVVGLAGAVRLASGQAGHARQRGPHGPARPAPSK